MPGYYQDFGEISQIAELLTSAYVYQGEYSNYRRRSHGSKSKGVSGEHFVVFTQNHDQVANRMNGERLGRLVDFEALKVAAGVMLLSPFVPLIFMGEEYGETSPFLYFVSHQDGDLIEGVRQGRRDEFKAFRWSGEPPDPQDPGTFLRSKLEWQVQECQAHKQLREFYAELLRIRKEFPALANSDMGCVEARSFENERALVLHRWKGHDKILALFNFGKDAARVTVSTPESEWLKVLNSRDRLCAGPGTTVPENLPCGPNHPILIEPLCIALYRSDTRGKT